MPFSLGKDISILEAKFQIYEDLSKEMLDKLERAVDKISEGNQAVALILERHENRLEQVDKADVAILELIKDLKDKIKEIEKKLEEVSQIKWMTLGCGVVLAVVATSLSTLASGWWTPAGMQDAAKASLTSK